MRVSVSTHPCQFSFSFLRSDSHPSGSKCYHCGFGVRFSLMTNDSIFSCAGWSCVCLVWRNVHSSSLPSFFLGRATQPVGYEFLPGIEPGALGNGSVEF